ncbi:hypothetical protein D3C72_2321490 [compost metagenome]
MIVQRCDIDPDAFGNVAGAEALEALLDDEGTRGVGNGDASLVAAFAFGILGLFGTHGRFET